VRLVFRDSVEHALAQMHEARAKGEMDEATTAGRDALRAAFRANHVDAAHSLVGGVTHQDVAEGPYLRMRCSFQHCSRCEQQVLIDKKLL
jgi:hypothetical protein